MSDGHQHEEVYYTIKAVPAGPSDEKRGYVNHHEGVSKPVALQFWDDLCRSLGDESGTLVFIETRGGEVQVLYAA